MTRRIGKTDGRSTGRMDRLHVAFGNKLVISAQGKVGIVALLLLVAGLTLLVGGMHWTLPFLS